jgi:hypothetical protein
LGMRMIGKDTTFIMYNGFRIDRGGDWTTHKNFGHDVVHNIIIVFNHTIFQNGRIGEKVNFGTGTPHTRKRVTRFTNVGRLTGSINVGAKSIGGFVTAG